MKIWIAASKIGVDLDDVLFDFVGGLAVFHNETFGTKFKEEDFHTYQFSGLFGCGQEEAIKRVDSFLDSSYFADLKPIEGAAEGIKRLVEQKNSFELITSRHKRLFDLTQMQLKKHFPMLADAPINFSKNAYVEHGIYTKEEICRKHELRYMIEDSPIYAKQCAAYSTVLLMEKPWNSSVSFQKRIFKISGWEDINNLPSKQTLNELLERPQRS